MTTDPERYARDAAMILRPDRWPRWPILPLKRLREGQGWPEYGVLLALAEYRTAVFKANLFALPPTEAELLALEKIEYPSFTALLDDGWTVD